MGAGNIQRAHESFNTALLHCFLMATGFGLLVMVGAKLIALVFTQDPIVVANVVSYVFVIALSYGLMAVSMLEASAFQAVGRSWPGFWIFFLRFFVVSVPVAYLATVVFGFGIIGVWVAIALGNVISAIVGYIWIRRVLTTMHIEDIPVHE